MIIRVKLRTSRSPPSAWSISGQLTLFRVWMCVLNLSLLLAGTDQQFSALVYRRKAKSTLSIVRCGMLIRSEATHRRGAISCICNFFIEKELRIASEQMRFSWFRPLTLMWRASRLLVPSLTFPPKLGIILKYHYLLWNCNDCLFLDESVIKIVNLGFICIC